MRQKIKLFKKYIDTELGRMIAIFDNEKLYLLEFADKNDLEKEILDLKKEFDSDIEENNTVIYEKLNNEIKLYFKGKLKKFKTPFLIRGTEFQKLVLNELLKVPYGKTISYKQLAIRIGNHKSSRAVANAIGKNLMLILIPCHRIINSNNSLGGYNCGIERKQKLLTLENQKIK
ncbi:hypothetical protein CG006_02065 [Mesoplasma florum]|uniref:methylated-DNA--[protein]-cysteine S-methyltransferase n=1 Tax=Mesoplasma florum TaxID=2151 RepID=UPI000D0291FE|nr:methylated-DNA--[protein]-cysteine S-methyltransferase [Mesoplasma florum]AVN63762.1 hypothetical protein CG006_02065 [Mesoplasma florum]